MRRISIVLLAGVSIVAAIVWLTRGQSRRTPREPPSEPRVVTRNPAMRVAKKEKPVECSALPDGGFSCGECREDADCPAGSGCVSNLATGRTACQGSDCKSDRDCDQGTSCRVVGRTVRDEPLRACVAPGSRPAGSACDPHNGGDPLVSCGPKLLCVEGGCAPACEPKDIDEPSECVGGLPCVSTEVGWGCTPTCKEQGARVTCGGGKTCSFLSVEGPISLCTHAVGKNCLGPDGGCPPDHDCLVETSADTERTTFSCVARCTFDPKGKPCPESAVCVAGKEGPQCRRLCNERDSRCGSGERCVKATGTIDTWFCSAV